MTPAASVLGVLGWCWVGLSKPTLAKPAKTVAGRHCVLSVLGSRTRVRMRSITAGIKGETNCYANPEKPNTPNTLNTEGSNSLISLSLVCVGFVLGWINMCWVLISEGWQ